jgi:hypothetical protein
MHLRPLIIAALMFLSLAAQASSALLGCGSVSCCDPSPTQGCPPSAVQLGCEQICTSQADSSVAVAAEHEQYKPQPDSIDPLPVLQTYLLALLANSDVLLARQQEDDRAAAHAPSTPTYLATARLRL